MKPKIYVTRVLPGDSFRTLFEKYDVELNESDLAPDEKTLIEKIRDKDGLLCLLTDKITKSVIDAGGRLKIIANYAVGYDNIDVDYATQKGIMVTNTPGVLTDATAELTWALILGCARRITEGDRFTREGKFIGWSPTLFLGYELKGKTLGIIGAGRIGTKVGMIANGFEMKIIYCDKKRNTMLEEKLGANKVELHALLQDADFVTIHVPLTKETYHLIGKKELGLMKPTCVLVNTSRGAVIDEHALVEALKEHRIAYAGLDVYEFEPKISPELISLDNVILLPHIGSATFRARIAMADIAIKNLETGLRGKIPPNLVNPEVLRYLKQ